MGEGEGTLTADSAALALFSSDRIPRCLVSKPLVVVWWLESGDEGGEEGARWRARLVRRCCIPAHQ